MKGLDYESFHAQGELEGFLRGLLLTDTVPEATIERVLGSLEVLGVVLDREWVLRQREEL